MANAVLTCILSAAVVARTRSRSRPNSATACRMPVTGQRTPKSGEFTRRRTSALSAGSVPITAAIVFRSALSTFMVCNITAAWERGGTLRSARRTEGGIARAWASEAST